MKLLRYERFARSSILQISFFGIMGILLFALPSFVLTGAFYAVTGYLVLAGVLGVACFIHSKDKKHFLDYASVAVCAVLILFGIGGMAFTRYLVNVSPLYLAALLLLQGAYYFSVALCEPRELRRSVLIILSMIVFLGGVGVVIFTFGFGVQGLSGLANISGAASILSCIYALVVYLFYQRNAKRNWGSEERI